MFFSTKWDILLLGTLIGLKPKSLHINPFGLTVVFETVSKKNIVEIKKIFVALAGPLVNLAICIMAIVLRINEDVRQTIIYSNILIFIFNLIPIYPLDGGRIVKSILKLKYKGIIVDNIINKLSNAITIMITITSSILILYYKNIAILFLVIYLWIIVMKENKEYTIKRRVYEIISDNKITKKYKNV